MDRKKSHVSFNSNTFSEFHCYIQLIMNTSIRPKQVNAAQLQKFPEFPSKSHPLCLPSPEEPFAIKHTWKSLRITNLKQLIDTKQKITWNSNKLKKKSCQLTRSIRSLISFREEQICNWLQVQLQRHRLLPQENFASQMGSNIRKWASYGP